MHKCVLCVVVFVGSIAAAQTESWQPAGDRVKTRWAGDISAKHPPAGAYPRPTMVRDRWMSLDGLWQFADEGDAPIGRELPGRILVPFCVESALSGVGRHADRLWYRRMFMVPDDWAGDRVLLHFGAVDWRADVFVDGMRLGWHAGGYDGFSFDITDALGDAAEHELVVGVHDPTDAGEQPRGKQVRAPGGIWYTPVTGIWQTVWLEPVPTASIRALRLTPTLVGVRARVEATGGADTVSLVASEGVTEVARASGPVGSEIVLSIADPHLWSPDDPHLYDLVVGLRRDGKVIDEVRSYFGLRTVSVGKGEDGVTRMLLNGEPLFQVGLLDQGLWPDGLYTAPCDEALRYDIEVARRLGFNMLRKHVKVEPERWYTWCDRLGVLVWQDMPSGDNKTPESHEQFERELRRLVGGRANHPSIIMWVVFNEGWGQHDTERYTRLVKELDPGRLVSNASGWTDKGVGDIVDVHAYPGPAAPALEPVRAAVLGEFGGLGLGVDGHTWEAKAWGYQGMADGEQLTGRYVNLMRRVWDLSRGKGLSAAVYTQLTDVETECNGLMTYDRAVVKVDEEAIAAANAGRFPRIEPISSSAEPVRWRYTFDDPGGGWFEPGFDDSGWGEGSAGFGTAGTPGAEVGTVWDGPAIWLRRVVQLPELGDETVQLLVHHDEDATVYINGVPAVSLEGYTTSYELVPISPVASSALRVGANTIAVTCRQTTGGQYIDVDLVRVLPAR